MLGFGSNLEVVPAFGDEILPASLQTLERALARLASEGQQLGDIVLYSAASLILAVDQFSVDNPDVLPYRESTYFQVVALHPGLHPVIMQALDAELTQNGMSLAHYRNLIQRDYPDGNPFRRPLPLGVSLGIRHGSGPSASILAVKRSSRVALNPGVLTTAVDEGVQTISGFPETYLVEGLQSELHYAALDPGLQDKFRQCQLIGLTFPDLSCPDDSASDGRRSGANVLYDVELSAMELDHLAEHMRSVAIERGGSHEFQSIHVESARNLLDLVEVSHSLVEYARWVTNGENVETSC